MSDSINETETRISQITIGENTREIGLTDDYRNELFEKTNGDISSLRGQFNTLENRVNEHQGDLEEIKGYQNNLNKSIFNIVHPVGEVYVQFPGQKSPVDLYKDMGCTWTQLDYKGAFFRSDGGEYAKEFINFIKDDQFYKESTNKPEPQKDGVGRHTHNIGVIIEKNEHQHKFYQYYENEATSGGGSKVTTLNNTHADNTTEETKKTSLETHSHEATVYVDKEEKTDKNGKIINYDNTVSKYDKSIIEETRPVNYTIQIWKRTE